MSARIITIILCLLLMLSSCNSEVSEKTQWGSFTSDLTYSYDGKYLANQVAELDEFLQVRYIHVNILDANDNHEVYSFMPARARDFSSFLFKAH